MTHPVEKLIYQEARLLDQGLLDDWLALYTSDATYWIPIDENADPLKESSIIFDNHLRLQMRVEQIMRQARVAQNPSSYMMRMVSNISLQEQTSDRIVANFSMLLTEVRSGDWRQQGLGDMRQLPGHCELEAVNVDGTWKINRKKIVLLNRKQPITGLSFLI